MESKPASGSSAVWANVYGIVQFLETAGVKSCNHTFLFSPSLAGEDINFAPLKTDFLNRICCHERFSQVLAHCIPGVQGQGVFAASHFIPSLMEHLGESYYAGLLNAAEYHGAVHHRPQVFQVIVARNRPGIVCGKIRTNKNTFYGTIKY